MVEGYDNCDLEVQEDAIGMQEVADSTSMTLIVVACIMCITNGSRIDTVVDWTENPTVFAWISSGPHAMGEAKSRRNICGETHGLASFKMMKGIQGSIVFEKVQSDVF